MGALHAGTGESPTRNHGISYDDDASEILNFNEDDDDDRIRSNEGTPQNANSRMKNQPPSAKQGSRPESNVAPSPSARRSPKTWADPSARRPSQDPSPKMSRTGI